MFDFSRRYFSEPIDHAVVKIVPMVAKDRAATQLLLRRGHPSARLNETHYSAAGQPVAFSLIDEDPDYIQLEVFGRG